jgi:transcription elongation GreA/GreB family factor
MNSILTLEVSDFDSLLTLTKNLLQRHPDSTAAHDVRSLIDASSTTGEGAHSPGHVGLLDRVILQSAGDPSDTFEFEIVLPENEDLDGDRLSVLRPVCLATIGRPLGSAVEWDAPAGARSMIIQIIHKKEGR